MGKNKGENAIKMGNCTVDNENMINKKEKKYISNKKDTLINFRHLKLLNFFSIF